MTKTARAVHANRGTEVRYRKALMRLIDQMQKSTVYWLESSYRRALAQDALPSKNLQDSVKDVSKRWIARFDQMAKDIAKAFVMGGMGMTDNALRQAFKDAGWTVEFKMTRAVRDAANATVAENVALIRSIPQQYFTEVEGMVMRSFVAGRDLHTLSRELRKRYGITKRRAALIARDQNNKLTATVTAARREELGLYRAIWLHSHAGKEPRPDHVAADGEEFDIRKGMKLNDGWVQPGQLINCRCSSKTILPF